jgi:hypothetical protein
MAITEEQRREVRLEAAIMEARGFIELAYMVDTPKAWEHAERGAKRALNVFDDEKFIDQIFEMDIRHLYGW